MDSEYDFVLVFAIGAAEVLFALALMWLFSMSAGTAIAVSLIASFLVACVFGVARLHKDWKDSRKAIQKGRLDGDSDSQLNR